MKTLKTLLVTIAVLLCSTTVSAHDFEVDGIYYNVTSYTDLTVEVTYKGNSPSSAVYSESVEIPEYVVYNDCTYSVTSVGSFAFLDCLGLTDITIPYSVTSIGASAFSGCTSLPVENNIRYADTWAVAVTDSEALTYTLRQNTLGLSNGLFRDCVNITSVELPNTIKNIADAAFSGCTTLTNITIPYSVSNIGNMAFYSCRGLTNITIPNSVTNIGNHAFYECTGLINITIPNSVISIGQYAFSYCIRLDSISIGNSVTSIEESSTFLGCTNLSTVFIESQSVASMDNLKSRFGEQVTTYIIGENVTSIGNYAFSGCTGLANITIPNSVTSIGYYAFSGCSGLTDITIPNSVTSIGYYAFSNCTALKYIACEALVPPTCGTYTFDNVDTENCLLEVPASAVNAYATTVPWSDFNIKVSLVDGEDYENETDTEIGVITYTRTLNNLYWNSLYIPFEIPVSQLIENYDIAYINAMHSYDTDDNGAIDSMVMEVVKIKEGTLLANYPYLIRAKNEETKAMEIVVENSTLYAAESVTVDCSSVFTKFEITGTYQPLTNEEIDGCYALSGGTWKTMKDDATLNPFRLYLRISDREGSPVKVDTYALEQTSVTIRVQGENPGTTSIESKEIGVKSEESDATIYNLMGQPVKNPVKGSIYIQGGRKVVW